MNLNDLKGRKIEWVSAIRGSPTQIDKIIFYLDVGEVEMVHECECCENVYIGDICGDLKDLHGGTIIHFEERTIDIIDDSPEGSGTATFYDIQTDKGCVNIRWNGESNGCYSEEVSVIYRERLN